MTRPVNEEQRARVAFLHAQGMGRNQIALEVGISAGTVTKLCTEMGLSFDRGKTKAATAARVIDLKARKTAIIERLYLRTETVLDRLEADTYTYRMAIPGKESERVEDSAPPAADERSLSGAISGYLASAAKLEDRDSESGVTSAHSLLDSLLGKFVEAASEAADSGV